MTDEQIMYAALDALASLQCQVGIDCQDEAEKFEADNILLPAAVSADQ